MKKLIIISVLIFIVIMGVIVLKNDYIYFQIFGLSVEQKKIIYNYINKIEELDAANSRNGLYGRKLWPDSPYYITMESAERELNDLPRFIQRYLFEASARYTSCFSLMDIKRSILSLNHSNSSYEDWKASSNEYRKTKDYLLYLLNNILEEKLKNDDYFSWLLSKRTDFDELYKLLNTPEEKYRKNNNGFWEKTTPK